LLYSFRLSSVIRLGGSVIEPPPSPNPPVLPYGTRPVSHPRPLLGIVVALLATVSGLFGGLMLFHGILGIPFVFSRRNRNSVTFGGDVFELAMFLVIGVFCLYISVRWYRKVPALMSGG
jgi:hypothetical protein